MQEKANPRPQRDPFQAKHSSGRWKRGRGSTAGPWPPVVDAAHMAPSHGRERARLNSFPLRAETQRKGKRDIETEIEREAGLGLLAMNLPFQEPEWLVEL